MAGRGKGAAGRDVAPGADAAADGEAGRLEIGIEPGSPEPVDDVVGAHGKVARQKAVLLGEPVVSIIRRASPMVSPAGGLGDDGLIDVIGILHPAFGTFYRSEGAVAGEVHAGTVGKAQAVFRKRFDAATDVHWVERDNVSSGRFENSLAIPREQFPGLHVGGGGKGTSTGGAPIAACF